MPTSTQLNDYLGKGIGAICGNGYDAANDNHCAHFVCHVMGFRFGATCKMMSGGKQPGANIRVQEVFANCSDVGEWGNRPGTMTDCLVFVTAPAHVNVGKKHMDNVPKKHIGIFNNGFIWHYSNSHHKVMKETPELFAHHYPGQVNALFYGSYPTAT